MTTIDQRSLDFYLRNTAGFGAGLPMLATSTAGCSTPQPATFQYPPVEYGNPPK